MTKRSICIKALLQKRNCIYFLGGFISMAIMLIVAALGNPLLRNGFYWHYIPEMFGTFFFGAWFQNSLYTIGAKKFGLKPLIIGVVATALLSFVIIPFAFTVQGLVIITMLLFPLLLGASIVNYKNRRKK
jgi:hypothetical protein